MSLKPPRNDAERLRIVNAMSTLGAYLGTIPHSIANHRAAIRLRMNDGLKAASYDGDGISSGGSSSPVERAAALDRGAAAAEADYKLDSGLAHIAHGMDLVEQAIAPFPIFDQAERDKGKQQPGKGVCPIGSCANCWEFGRDEPRSDRYKDACDVCGRWKADHGERMIKPLWELRVRQGKPRITTADLKRHAPHLLPKEQAS